MASSKTKALCLCAFLAPLAIALVWQSGLLDPNTWQIARKILLVNDTGESVAEGEMSLPGNPQNMSEFSGTFRLNCVPESRHGPGVFDGLSHPYTATNRNGNIRITLSHDPNMTHTWLGINSVDNLNNMTFTNNYFEGDAEPQWKGRVLVEHIDR